MFDQHEIQLVAITLEDGSVAIMQFVTAAWNERERFEREATDEAIQAEIDRTGLPQTVVSWRRVDPADLPQSRDARDAWRDDGAVIAVDESAIPIPPKRTVPKSVIVSRLIAAGKIGAAYQALNSNPEYWARWVASDRPAINYDDPDALALLRAIGADPEEILAP